MSETITGGASVELDEGLAFLKRQGIGAALILTVVAAGKQTTVSVEIPERELWPKGMGGMRSQDLSDRYLVLALDKARRNLEG